MGNYPTAQHSNNRLESYLETDRSGVTFLTCRYGAIFLSYKTIFKQCKCEMEFVFDSTFTPYDFLNRED